MHFWLTKHRKCVVCLICLFMLLSTSSCQSVDEAPQYCSKPSQDSPSDCDARTSNSALSKIPRYILYDVNPPEGFNLRRDVYMRMAIFASKLSESEDWHLVLPPWGRLYHWRSKDVGKQNMLPWGLYFSLGSLQKFAPVVEMSDFLNDNDEAIIEQVFVLQHYKDAFKDNYTWEEKFDVEPCREKNSYRLEKSGLFSGEFWGHKNITAQQVDCLSFHGFASQLEGAAANYSSVMFDHAEIALHDGFGDAHYWRARRSMRFAVHLRVIADEFRLRHFNSTDEVDRTVLPDDWTREQPGRNAVGGNYMCAHLRRRDFLWGRPKDVPSILSTALQIRYQLEQLRLNSVFIATDAPVEETDELQDHLPEFKVFRYEPLQTVREAYKDGGVAIIEQIICSHARYFIGTHESTFTFRIQEEREILGFPVNSTFNRLCGDNDSKCKQPTRWKIVY